MEIPLPLLSVLSTIGLFYTAYIIMWMAKNGIHYLRFKTFPKTIQEEKLILIEKENERLSRKISQLENENEEITKMILQKLNS